MTVNQSITDSLIQHQAHYIRLSKSEAKKVEKVFKKYNIDMLSELRGIKSVKKKKDLRNLLKEIKKINNELFNELLDYSNERLSAVYAEEIGFISALYQKAVDKAFPKSDFQFNVPDTKEYYPDELLIGGQGTVIKGKLIIDGTPLSAQLEALENINYRKIEQKVNYAFASGEGYELIEKELGGEAQTFMSKTQQQFLSVFITAYLLAESEAFNDFYQENKKVFPYGYYVAVLDNKTTPICMSLHGNRYPIDEGPRPPQHYNCRSQFIMEADLDHALGHLYPYNVIKEKMGHVKVYKDFGEFLRKQPKSFVEDILGIQRAKLFMDNKLPLKRYIDINDNRFYTLEEMKKKNKSIFENLE